MSTQIHDLGYRAYEGERSGVGWAIRSLMNHSIRRALGLKRAGRHKIAPGLSLLIAFGPAIALAGVAAWLRGEIIPDLIDYGAYTGIVGFALFIFTAAVAPGVLTTDRTSGMLALYLASPLTRTTYVVAKAAGILAVMLIVSVGPIAVLMLGYTFAGAGPGGVIDVAEILGRAALGGLLMGGLFTGLGMFVSSIPRRWGIASLAIVAVSIVTTIVVSGLTEETNVTEWITLLAPNDVAVEAAQRILGDPQPNLPALDARPTWAVVSAALGWVVAFAGATWWRYQRIPVER